MIDITVTLPSGQTLRRPSGVRAEEILQAEEFHGLSSPIVAVLVNKALASLRQAERRSGW